MPNPPNVFLLKFAPETWSSLEKLLHFVGPPLPDDSNVRIGLRDCHQHLYKVLVLRRVADKLRPSLIEDRKELERLGGTQNLNGAEFAATMEAAICSLYSAIDGLRTFIFGTYRRVKGVQRGSNGKLFERAANNEYGAGFPSELRNLIAVAHAGWFPALRELRTELTHGSTGTCHFRETENVVMYHNEGIKRGGKTLFIDDIESTFTEWQRGTTELIAAIAEFHLRTLEPRLHLHHCGMYRYRWYGRLVAPSSEMSFGDGHCLSYDWFEAEPDYFCPLAHRCGAYTRKWPGGSTEFFKPNPNALNSSVVS